VTSDPYRMQRYLDKGACMGGCPCSDN